MFALLLQRAALLIGADYRPRDCTQPMQSWKSYISQDQGPIIIGTIPITCSDHLLRSILFVYYILYILWSVCGILYTQYRTKLFTNGACYPSLYK